MRCIFCKSQSNTFNSIEHIIPESLGNTKTTLPPGIVCDNCNNYFSRKVEGELLNSDYFKHARFRNAIPNKKRRIPLLEPILGPGQSTLGAYRTIHGNCGIYPFNENSADVFLNHIFTHNSGTLYLPIPNKYDSYTMSRFLAKVGIELLTLRVMPAQGWEQAVIFRDELNNLRNFARYGPPPKHWQYHERRIYDEDHIFCDNNDYFNVLNEMDLIFSNGKYLFSVVCIFGVEYAIDMVNPDISGYENWLKQNQYISPLYDDNHKKS